MFFHLKTENDKQIQRQREKDEKKARKQEEKERKQSRSQTRIDEPDRNSKTSIIDHKHELSMLDDAEEYVDLRV